MIRSWEFLHETSYCIRHGYFNEFNFLYSLHKYVTFYPSSAKSAFRFSPSRSAPATGKRQRLTNAPAQSGLLHKIAVLLLPLPEISDKPKMCRTELASRAHIPLCAFWRTTLKGLFSHNRSWFCKLLLLYFLRLRSPSDFLKIFSPAMNCMDICGRWCGTTLSKQGVLSPDCSCSMATTKMLLPYSCLAERPLYGQKSNFMSQLCVLKLLCYHLSVMWTFLNRHDSFVNMTKESVNYSNVTSFLYFISSYWESKQSECR